MNWAYIALKHGIFKSDYLTGKTDDQRITGFYQVLFLPLFVHIFYLYYQELKLGTWKISGILY
jgi:hypothetical protein